jgi:hypothetical protein
MTVHWNCIKFSCLNLKVKSSNLILCIQNKNCMQFNISLYRTPNAHLLNIAWDSQALQFDRSVQHHQAVSRLEIFLRLAHLSCNSYSCHVLSFWTRSQDIPFNSNLICTGRRRIRHTRNVALSWVVKYSNMLPVAFTSLNIRQTMIMYADSWIAHKLSM